jgi:hypothetical protein
MPGIQQLLNIYPSSGYSVANSLRFRSSASAYLNRTPGSAGNRKTWTFSAWVKRGALGSAYSFFAGWDNSTGATDIGTAIRFNADALDVFDYTNATYNFQLLTTPVFRDPSSWYHVVIAFDTTQATTSNRIKVYVNGSQITSFSTATYPNQNTDWKINNTVVQSVGCMGVDNAASQFFDGYLADINFIDGQALTPSSFGQISTITGVWQPIAYTGTYGTNGFKLNFSNGTSTTTLGYDSSGNSNNWITNNISLTAGSTYDWMIDSPTPFAGSSYGVGNYAVLNPLYTGRSTLSNANLTASGTTDLPTIVPDSGNWYFEIDGVSKNWTPPATFPAASGNYNFGQRPFANTVTSGYKSLCTYNLPAASIVNGASYMAATLYTGNGATQSITNTVNGISFAPDFVWIKDRSNVDSHRLLDTIRGATKFICSDLTNAEATDATGLTAFTGTGFTLGSDHSYNASSQTYVGWQWKANGTAVSNTAGSITSQVSANTIAGFSVVTYTGTGSAATVGHGLGVAPSMIIVKNRSVVENWPVYHTSLTANGRILLNTTGAYAASSSQWNNTTPTSSVFTVNTDTGVNGSGNSLVAYCFAAIAGYSAFGSYTGNGSSDGPFVFTNFRPRWIMIKRTDTTSNWVIVDSSRNVYNPQDLNLYPNLSAAEDDYTSTYPFDMLSNGFKFRANYGNVNASGGTYIYACFAENPFQNALAR